MLNPAHVLETALLLLVAFLAGAVIGSLAKMLALRLVPARPAAAVRAVRPAASVAAEAALVATPIVEPVARPAQPAAPTEVPTPDFSTIVNALGNEASPEPEPEPELPLHRAMAPAREAGKTTSGHEVPSPQRTARRDAEGGSAPAQTQTVRLTAEDSTPAPSDTEVENTKGVTDATAPVELEMAVTVPSGAAPETIVAEGPVTPENTAETPPMPVEATEQVTTASEPPTEDETAAMRAIEGTWTPRRAPARRARKVPAPEGMVPEETPAPAVEQPGKPVGIGAPRDGAKDSLTNIIGVLPVIEKALNKLGVYHFDQLAEFSDENVSWLEGHLGIAGRIDREQWREQARELALVAGRATVAGE